MTRAAHRSAPAPRPTAWPMSWVFSGAFSAALATLALALVAFGSIATGDAVQAQGAAGQAARGSHAGQGSHAGHAAPTTSDVDAAEVAKPGDLPDLAIGRPEAPITIIEYASITCSHCGRFHNELLPEVKKKYIDTGIARFIVREFPLESVAAAAAMLVRCSEADVQLKFLDTLFARQQEWLASNDVRAPLVAIAGEFGLSEKAFDACLNDEALLKKVAASRTRGHRDFGVNSTPTFFINGKALVGPTTIEEFDEIIQPLRQADKEATTK